MAVLVTGGTGYIGSHTVVELQNQGYPVIVLDNLSNSSEGVIKSIEKITEKPIPFYRADIRDHELLCHIMKKEPIDCCIHFAGLKSVGESVSQPLKYYDNNVVGTLTLLGALKKYDIKNVIFSSSATVYGTPESIPIKEDAPTGQTASPYGTTKYMVERTLMDVQLADPDWNVVILRYFNPVGAHKSGLIGENPKGLPNNLMPYITLVATGKTNCLKIYGNDYDTHDGTGVRDYIHVMDVATAHALALSMIKKKAGLKIYNLGTGIGYSVLDVVKSFEKATGVEIPYTMAGRRHGDIAQYWADPKKAEQELGFRAKHNLMEMCEDAWRWQMNI